MCGVTHISPTGVAYDFCTLPVFRPLARISFQSFLWHIVILRIVAGYFRQPVYISSFYLVRMFIVYTFLMSNAKHFSAVQRAECVYAHSICGGRGRTATGISAWRDPALRHGAGERFVTYASHLILFNFSKLQVRKKTNRKFKCVARSQLFRVTLLRARGACDCREAWLKTFLAIFQKVLLYSFSS